MITPDGRAAVGSNVGDTGEVHCIAVEASFTGQSVHAVVAALQLTPEAEAAVRQRDVTWYYRDGPEN